LGAELIDLLANLAPLSTILAIDVEPLTPPAENVLVRRFNLNPFDEQRGFEAWSAELHEMIHLPKLTGACRRPIRGLFLGAAKYQVGRYECSTADERAAVLGCNVAGKWEVLHAVMRVTLTLDSITGRSWTSSMWVHFMLCAIPLIARCTTRQKLQDWNSAQYS
jgi:hypothetical protein